MCPYHTVPSGALLPPVLITAARGDARVPLWGPLKWAAKLRAAAGAASQPGWLSRASSALKRITDAPDSAHSGGGEPVISDEGGYRAKSSRRTERGPVLVCVSDEGGHFGEDRDFYAAAARDYAFLVSNMPPLV